MVTSSLWQTRIALTILPTSEMLSGPCSSGSDMVVASRLEGSVHDGAMPFLHRYVGTPLITRLLCLLTGVPLSDSQSGYQRLLAMDSALA